MGYITRYSSETEDAWVKSYESLGYGGSGTVDPVSKVFGWANHERFYAEMEAWCFFIDTLCPDFWPLSEVQNIFIAIVRAIYKREAQSAYYKGLDQGRAIVKQVEGVVDWATKSISGAVSDLQARVEREFINPLRTQAADLQNKINAASAQLGELNRLIADAKKALQTHEIRLQQLEAKAKQGFDISKLGKW
jgi:hypothetical protein